MLQGQYQVTHTTASAHLAQTMTLLSLTIDELRQQVESELASNPALEIVEERRCPNCHRLMPMHGICPLCSKPADEGSSEPIVFVSMRDETFHGTAAAGEEYPDDNGATENEDLPTYILKQIAPELARNERAIAAYILTHLDEDGFLTTTPFEIARYHHVPIAQIQRIIGLIQHSDPLGVGSPGPKEALLVQLEVLAETSHVPPLAQKAIIEGLDLLSRHQYAELAHKLHSSLQTIKEIARFITDNLNPFPSRSHWGDSSRNTEPTLPVFHQPDIIISMLNDVPESNLVVEIMMPYQGTLRVNPMFRQALREINDHRVEDWKADLDRASLLVKCIQQRNHTMKRLMQRLVSLQRDFILMGEVTLKPLTRAQLAKELEVHESTISRAVADKAVQLPNNRIIPMSMFFERNLSIRTILKHIIGDENRPLSDSELVLVLHEQGINVSRRTVAKYRAMEGILPAHLRQHPIALTA
jgi:RNA polymerase sigma-54 factor